MAGPVAVMRFPEPLPLRRPVVAVAVARRLVVVGQGAALLIAPTMSNVFGKVGGSHIVEATMSCQQTTCGTLHTIP